MNQMRPKPLLLKPPRGALPCCAHPPQHVRGTDIPDIPDIPDNQIPDPGRRGVGIAPCQILPQRMSSKPEQGFIQTPNTSSDWSNPKTPQPPQPFNSRAPNPLKDDRENRGGGSVIRHPPPRWLDKRSTQRASTLKKLKGNEGQRGRFVHDGSKTHKEGTSTCGVGLFVV